MNKEINNNDFDYVDLKLPSRTLWATCNVGASKPSESGLYFQWGDTIGYTKEQVGKDKQFYWSDYKWNPLDDWETFTKYTSASEALELEDDAAHANMGRDWHMPAPYQFRELIDNTTSEWATLDDVNGRLFTSKKDESKSIFIPAAGYAWNGSLYFSGIDGYVWSSMIDTKFALSGQFLFFEQGRTFMSYHNRCYGFSVRGVIG